MFLDTLNENERKTFMELCYLAMECDGEICQEEEEAVRSYAHECNLENYVRQNKNLATCMAELKNSSRSHRKIVFLELIGVWAADNEWKDSEIKMMEDVAAGLAIPPSCMNRLKRWARELRTLIVDGYNLVMED